MTVFGAGQRRADDTPQFDDRWRCETLPATHLISATSTIANLNVNLWEFEYSSFCESLPVYVMCCIYLSHIIDYKTGGIGVGVFQQNRPTQSPCPLSFYLDWRMKNWLREPRLFVTATTKFGCGNIPYQNALTVQNNCLSCSPKHLEPSGKRRTTFEHAISYLHARDPLHQTSTQLVSPRALSTGYRYSR